MALNFEAPAKGALIKVTALNVVFYKSPSLSADKALKPASKHNTYTNWAVGDTLKSLGNVIQNTEGTWLEIETITWYRKNIFTGWFPVLITVYYHVEDQTATWVTNSVIGIKPPVITTGSGSGTPQPEAEKEDKTLQKVGIAIGIASLLIALRK